MDCKRLLTLEYKIPVIPLLLVYENFVSDFNKKANLFNDLFVSICTPSKNASTLPYLPYKTNGRIDSFHAAEKDIFLIIKPLEPTKAHWSDNSSVRMTKICNESVTILLKVIFKESLKNGVFPEVWKKANVVPVHKNEDKRLVKNSHFSNLQFYFQLFYK